MRSHRGVSDRCGSWVRIIYSRGEQHSDSQHLTCVTSSNHLESCRKGSCAVLCSSFSNMAGWCSTTICARRTIIICSMIQPLKLESQRSSTNPCPPPTTSPHPHKHRLNLNILEIRGFRTLPHKPQHPTPHTLSCRLVLSHHANLHPPRALPAGGGSWIRVPRQPDDWRWQLQPLPPQERHTHGVLPLHPCFIRHHPSPCLRHPAQTHHCGRPGLRLGCLLVAETGVGLKVGLEWIPAFGSQGPLSCGKRVTDMGRDRMKNHTAAHHTAAVR